MRGCFLKNLTACLLVLALAVSVLPAGALAAEENGESVPMEAEGPSAEIQAPEAPEITPEAMPETTPEITPETTPETALAAVPGEGEIEDPAGEAVDGVTGTELPPDVNESDVVPLELDKAVEIPAGSKTKYFSFQAAPGLYRVLVECPEHPEEKASVAVWFSGILWDWGSGSRFFWVGDGATKYIQFPESSARAYTISVTSCDLEDLTRLEEGAVITREPDLEEDGRPIGDTQGFYFTAEQDGVYTVSLTNHGQNKYFLLSEMGVWDAEQGRWVHGGVSTPESDTRSYHLTPQEVLYIQVTVQQDCTIQVTRSASEPVTEFSIEMGEPEVIDSFNIRIPVVITAPLESHFWSALEYEAKLPDGTVEKVQISGKFSGSVTSEQMSFPIDIAVRPDTTYTYQYYVVDNLTTFTLCETEMQTYATKPASPAPVELTLDSPAKGTSGSTNSKQYFIFRSPRSGNYILNVGQGNGSAYYLNEGKWKRYSAPIYLKAGTFLYVYTPVYTSGSYELAVTAEDKEDIPYAVLSVDTDRVGEFYGQIGVSVSAPLSSSFRVGLDYKYTYFDREWTGTKYGLNVKEANKQYWEDSVMVEVLPDMQCEYRAFIQPENGEKIYAPNETVTVKPYTGESLELDKAQAIAGSGTLNFYRFVPPEDGEYMVAASPCDTNPLGMPILDERETKEFIWAGGDFHPTVTLKAGVPLYMHIRWDKETGGGVIKITKYTEIAAAAAATGEAAPLDSFRAGAFINIALPEHTQYEAGIEVEYEGETTPRQISVGTFTSFYHEQLTYNVWFETLPEKTYRYRAYLKANGGTIYGDWADYTAPADTSKNTLPFDGEIFFQEDTSIGFWSQERIFKFVPAVTGSYTVTATGSGAVAMADSLDSGWPERKTLEGTTSWTIHLEAGSPLYVWYSLHSIMNGALKISPALSLDTSSNGIEVSMPAERTGHYMFTAYDSGGRFLGCQMLEKKEAGMEALSVRLPVSSGTASLVKAFLGDPETGKPLRPALRAEIPQAGSGKA